MWRIMNAHKCDECRDNQVSCGGDPGDGSSCESCESNGDPAKCNFRCAPVAPLAAHLGKHGMDAQLQSPLFGILPHEIRQLVWKYALTDRQHLLGSGVHLLQTCRAIYVETYKLPFLLNTVKDIWDDTSRTPAASLGMLAPWQHALLQSWEFDVRQEALEQHGQLRDDSENSKAKERHDGFEILGHYFNREQAVATPGCECLYGARIQMGSKKPVDIDPMTIFPNLSFVSPRYTFAALPVTRLVLRIGREGWVGWGEDPTDGKRLAMDPDLRCWSYSFNMASLESFAAEQMVQNAGNRRLGISTYTTGEGWSKDIGTHFPDLEHLELVFETFPVKKDQIEAVAECATTWVFPLAEGSRLQWDGWPIEAASRHESEEHVNERNYEQYHTPWLFETPPEIPDEERSDYDSSPDYEPSEDECFDVEEFESDDDGEDLNGETLTEDAHEDLGDLRATLGIAEHQVAPYLEEAAGVDLWPTAALLLRRPPEPVPTVPQLPKMPLRYETYFTETRSVSFRRVCQF